MSSIKQNFLYTSILTAANYIFPLIVYPYVSRVLGVTKIGACNFVDSIVQYFILVSMFGITSIGIREIARAKAKNENLNEVFNNLFSINALFTIVSALILIVVIYAVPSLYEYRKLLFIGVIKVISNFFLIEWFFRGLEDFRYITLRTILVKCLYIILVFLFVRDESDYFCYYFLTVLIITINSIINQIYARKYISVNLSKVNLKMYVVPIVIMGIYSIMTSMYTTFNTAYLGFVAGDTQVGYYTTAHTLYGALLAFFSAFTSVMLPRMTSLLSEGKFDRFKSLLTRSANVLFAYSFPFVFLFIVFASEIIQLYAGAGYAGAVIPMQICMPLMIIIGYEQIIITQGLLPLDKNKAVLVNAFVGAIAGVSASLVLVNKYMSVGSSMVWVISEVCVLISASIYIKKYINFKFPLKILLKELFIYLPLLPIFIIIKFRVGMPAFYALIICFIFAIAYAFVVQRFILKQVDMINLTNSISNKFLNR